MAQPLNYNYSNGRKRELKTGNFYFYFFKRGGDFEQDSWVWAHSNIQWSILNFSQEILLIMMKILLFLFHWHLTYLAFAARWKKGCYWGTTDMLLACSLLWPMAICLYTYTTGFLASLVHGREGANKCIGLYGTTHVMWPWGSWWTSPVCRIWCRKVCSFPQATFSQPMQGRRAKRGDARQSWCFHFSADGSYPHLLCAAFPRAMLFCFIPVRLLYKETKNRFQDKITTALKKCCVWWYLEQQWEAKKEVDPNSRIKINVGEFNVTQSMVEQRLLEVGGLVYIQLQQSVFST